MADVQQAYDLLGLKEDDLRELREKTVQRVVEQLAPKIDEVAELMILTELLNRSAKKV